ncbi:MAG: beta-ketoacyl-ACP synthase II [Deltaproteobacteria bacterium]|nr:beta-ketoacyl-ACP synthase II [Deltaproteobacteria bacterium]
MDRRSERVVITGIGLVGPCGIGVEETWAALLAGRSGVGHITAFDATAFSARIAGEVKGWDPLRFVDKRKLKEIDRFTEFALGAASLALDDAAIELTDEEREETACVLGVGLGGLAPLERAVWTLREKGPSKVSPYTIPMTVGNMAAGQISMTWGLRGPLLCPSTACASGAHAIGEAAEMVRSGRARVALAGGAEATITPTGMASFQAMYALSRRNDEPTRASRPFDRARDGFVCSEGAAVLVLEPLSRALARGAKIYAEVTGYGASSDAHHPVQPAPEGRGARSAMARALAHAQIDPSEVDYINAHGTSTPQGDVQECRAILRLFGDHASSGKLWVSSTKSMTGHLLGAAGALEASVCALACQRGEVPPTINVDDQDPECGLDVVALEARRRPVRHALSNSFGFGGCNVSLALSRCEP